MVLIFSLQVFLGVTDYIFLLMFSLLVIKLQKTNESPVQSNIRHIFVVYPIFPSSYFEKLIVHILHLVM